MSLVDPPSVAVEDDLAVEIDLQKRILGSDPICGTVSDQYWWSSARSARDRLTRPSGGTALGLAPAVP